MRSTPFPAYIPPKIWVKDVFLSCNFAQTGFTSNNDNNEEYSDGGEFIW